MLFDSHAHYDDKRFDEDRDIILSSMAEAEVSLIMNVGADMRTSRKSVALANKYSFIYAAVGVHPHDTKDISENDIQELLELSKHPKVKAIGEIGLDYFHNHSPKELQLKWFERQMQLAAELNLPVIIHDRDAHQDCMAVLKRYDLHKTGGVLHCFSGSTEMAREAIKMGMVISIAGPITYKNNVKTTEVVKEIPLEHMLIETDCPYLTPHPYRGERNSSLYVKYVAEKIAEIKGIAVAEVARVTKQNACKLFKI